LEIGFDALWDELGETHIQPASQAGRRPAGRSLLKDVEGPTHRLKEALTRLSQEEHLTTGLLPGHVMLLREALKRLDKVAAKGMSLQELDYWCDRFPEVRWDDPREVRRIARVALLASIPGQVWEVRRRGVALGRPLLPVNQSVFFPDEETLDAYDQVCGRQPNYYVAATRPRWRIVWSFRRVAS
jgi:hypothetical protein